MGILSKKQIIIISVVVLCLVFGIALGVFVMISPKTTTTVGEITYIYYYRDGDSASDGTFVYYIYLKPLGNAKNEDWILLTLLPETETQSEKNIDISKMPELQVGAIVEVERNIDVDKPTCDNYKMWVRGFFAESIKLVENYSDEMQSEASRIELKKSFSSEHSNADIGKVINGGKLVGIVPISEPVEGYFVYVEQELEVGLSKFLVDNQTNRYPDDPTFSILESGTTGVKVDILSSKDRLFVGVNKDVCALIYIVISESE